MKKKDLENLKLKSILDLRKEITSLKKDEAVFKIDLAMGKVKNVHTLSQKKRDIAQVATILTFKSQAVSTRKGEDENDTH